MRSLFAAVFLSSILFGAFASAETAKITCTCGSTYRFGGGIGDRFITEGVVTLTTDVEDEWEYKRVAQKACRKKFHKLEIEVGVCSFADDK